MSVELSVHRKQYVLKANSSCLLNNRWNKKKFEMAEVFSPYYSVIPYMDTINFG
jgi:hypothetical protein